MPESAENKTLVIVPTYNEADNIRTVLQRLVRHGDLEVLFVDDSSPDGTAELISEAAQSDSSIHLLSRPGRGGLGTAYVTGFRWALERGYATVVEMDADLSHDPADVPRLAEAASGADLAIGSRYVPGGEVRNWGAFRRLLSKAGNVYAQIFMGWRVKDSTSGFRAYSSGILGSLDLDEVGSEGYAFQIEMVRRVRLAGGTVTEIPITFVERTEGRSKMSRRIVLEALWRVPAWAFRDRVLRRKNR